MSYPKLTPIIAKGTTEPRYLEDRFADVVNVKDFGAKGNGITDDYSVIQTALTTLGGSGKTLFFPSGTYRLTASLEIPSKLKLLGEENSVLKRDFAIGSTGHGVIGFLVPLQNEIKIYDVEIRNIVFDGNGPSYPTQSFDIFVIDTYPTYNVVFDNCTFKNVVDFHALDIAYASRVDILNCKFIGFSNPGANSDEWAANKREAIQFDLGSIDNSFRNNKIRIENCYFGPSDEFGSWTTGIGNHGYLDASDQCSDIIIKNNFFDNVLYCGITCLGFKNVIIESNIIYTKGDGIHVISRHNSTENTKAICENINIVNNIIQGTNASPSGYGVYLWCSAGRDISDVSNAFNKNISIYKNKVIHIGTGVYCTCGENISIENNYFSVVYGYAGTIYKTKVNANVFDNLTQGGIYTSKNYHNLTNAKENIEYNKDFVVSSNIYTNPAVRCIHVSSDGKKNILVEKNVVFDSASQSAASAVTVGYIQVDGTRTNSVIKNNVVFADHDRGVSYAFYCSKTSDVAFNNRYIVNGSTKYPYDTSNYPEAHLSYIPSSDNSLSLGVAAARWSTVYAGTGSINTSDAREKSEIGQISESLAKAWGKVDISAFKFNDSIKKKGNDARIHIGVVAQQVMEAFQSEGLDASKYGLFCYDEWEDEFEEFEDGTKVKTQSAGNRYGIRYDEALALECAYQRWRLKQLEERVNQLTNFNN